jgi:two-component system, chemotaxis family, CheB/CheR fusion protein
MQALSQDMLISVTSFFRDRVAFDRMREEVVRMLEGKPPAKTCGSGWPAAPAAKRPTASPSSCTNCCWRQKPARRVQIFASDIDEVGPGARAPGGLPGQPAGRAGPDHAGRHFVRHADGYEVSKVLAQHGDVRPPQPGAGPALRAAGPGVLPQRAHLPAEPACRKAPVIKTFHYALNPDGLLFLGRSESIHNSETHFEAWTTAAHTCFGA